MVEALLLLVAFYLPGHFLGRALVRKGDGWGEAVMLRLAASAAVAASVLVLLALAGWFRVPVIVGSFGACGLVAWLLTGRREGFGATFSGWDAAILALVGGSFALYAARPAEYVLNSRDPGVYTLIADRLARTGEFFVRDPLVGAVTRFHDFARGEKYPGLYLYGEDLLVPQFFPGPFAFLGFGNLVGGLWGSLYVVPIFGALAVGAAYLLGSELFGRWAGLLGAGLLATSYAEVWWSRHPSSEVVTQFFVLAGLWLARRFVRGAGTGTGLMAGLLLGGAMLVRVDAFLAAAALPLLAGYDLFVGKPVRRWLYPAVPLALAGLAGLLYLNTIAGRYLNLIYGRHDLDEALKLAPYAVAGTAILVGILWILRRRHAERVDAWVKARGGRMAAVGALAVVGAALWGYFVLPLPWESLPEASRDYDAYREQILVRLTWFVSPPTAILALCGLVLASRRIDAARILLLAAVLGFGVLYTTVPNVAPDLPWATRRFVPAFFPGVALLAGYAAVEAGRLLGRSRGRRSGLVLAVALAALTLGWTASITLPIVGFRELEGAISAFGRVEGLIPDDAEVVYVEVPDATDRSASTFEFLYEHPVLPYSRDRFRQETDELRGAGLLDDAVYVTIDGRPAPLISGVEFEEVAREEVALPRLDPVEGQEDHLSTRTDTLRVQYRIFRIQTQDREQRPIYLD